MKVEKHTRRKGGAVYWTVHAESSLEHQRLENVPGLNRSRYQNGGTFGTWYTGSPSILDAARVCADGPSPAAPIMETGDAHSWATITPEDVAAATVAELRTLASDRARAERPEEPRTPISQTWPREALEGWILRGEWYTSTRTATPAQPALFGAPGGPVAAPAPSPMSTQGGDLAATLAGALAPFLATQPQPLDSEEVRRIVREELAGHAAPLTVTVVRPDGTAADVGVQHRKFPALLRWVGLGKNVCLVGPPGTGKSYAAGQVARALERPYEVTAFCAQSSKSDLLGFVDAMGVYRASAFRRAWEAGGVWLADEIDAAPAPVLLALNDALERRVCAFPDGQLAAHPEFRCVAGANTDLRGGSREFSGRQAIDGASRDRFAFLPWTIDETLETARGAVLAWTRHVQALRKAAEAARVALIISPRASIHGGDLIAAGEDWEDVEEAYIWRGCSPEIRSQVRGALPADYQAPKVAA